MAILPNNAGSVATATVGGSALISAAVILTIHLPRLPPESREEAIRIIRTNHEEAAVVARMRGEHKLFIVIPEICQCRQMFVGKVWVGTSWRCEYCFVEVPGLPENPVSLLE